MRGLFFSVRKSFYSILFFVFNSASCIVHRASVFSLHLFLIFNLSFLIFNSALAQSPLAKQWDARFGGDGDDWLRSFQQTSDGGFILGGYSYSGISGDKTQPSWGSNDFWIVKIDALGNKQWDKRFGGTMGDELYSIRQTTDGGYILGGFSDSGIGGDKTQASWGGNDYWIVKTDSLGNKLWDKRYGGTDVDYLFSIEQTTDGGFIIGGYSASGIGGDKTQASWGSYDYWIVKTDSLGNALWDKRFGGTDIDFLISIKQTTDGGFILGGYSSSNISGNKTQVSLGVSDYWVIKIDSLGIKQWDKDFGGTGQDYLFSLQQTKDGGYILGGFSTSPVSGDKTQPLWGGYDYWIVKIDSAGTKQWDKDFGGTNIEDYLGSVVQTSDSGYLLCGNSFSNISGDKTENNLGLSQAWIVKTDSLGNKLWDKTIFSAPEMKVYPHALQTREGCYAVGEGSTAGIGGYRTQANWDNTHGSDDYWIVLFCDSTTPPTAAATAAANICPGTCTNFTNLSVNATSYIWTFAGANPSTSIDADPSNICYNTPGNYSVQLIATNANGSDTLTLNNYVTVYPYPPPQGILQSGDTLIANQGAVSYQWYYSGNSIPGATDYFYIASQSGDYNVVCTDANGCEVEAAIFNVLAEIQSAIGTAQLAIYPNPVGNKCTIHNAQFPMGAAATITVYNIIGVAVQSELTNQKSEMSVDVGRLPSGIYWIELKSDKTFRAKFVKQ